VGHAQRKAFKDCSGEKGIAVKECESCDANSWLVASADVPLCSQVENETYAGVYYHPSCSGCEWSLSARLTTYWLEMAAPLLMMAAPAVDQIVLTSAGKAGFPLARAVN
jgi:hypothetical protein